jgi:hypothetical protein
MIEDKIARAGDVIISPSIMLLSYKAARASGLLSLLIFSAKNDTVLEAHFGKKWWRRGCSASVFKKSFVT